MSEDLNTISKILSFVLRHQPENIGLILDAQGWASVEDLIAKANQHGQHLTRELVVQVVAQNDKQRFSLSADGLKIRANQGHSLKVDLALTEKCPPEILYHGTASRFLDSILVEGLKPQARQHVHLSQDEETAIKVGQRHGKPVVLKIAALQMMRSGHCFYLSENQVWLTERVPVDYLTVLNNSR